MDGVIVINKEQGMTSHDVVAKLRHIFQTKKIGHTGTLDPIATGVLVVCVNKATRLVQYLTCDDKTYEVEMKFGIKTDTGDRTGNIIEEGPTDINPNKLRRVLRGLIRKQKQVPPMYSAIKVKGKKLYEYAREGQTIWREPRDIEVYDIQNVYLEGDILKFTIHCSKGTYIRTICETIAYKVGTVGTMTELNRIQAGNFTIEQSVKLDEASESNIIGLEELFDDEVVIGNVKKDDLKMLVNGMPLYFNKPDGIYKIYTDNYYTKKFIGLGSIKERFLQREIIL